MVRESKMPWKLLLFILMMVLFVVFTGFNLENKATINFGFAAIEDVPVFISLFFAFLLGILFSLPVFLFQRSKLIKKYKAADQDNQDIQNKQKSTGNEYSDAQ
jgi:uncharacterized integral membrane protein